MNTETAPSKSNLRYLTTAIRLLMGLGFFVFGLNGFLNFIPPPTTPMPEAAMAFAGALMKTGYMFKMIAGTELIVGALLLLNIFVPLALALIAPLIVNIVAFHIFLSPEGTAPGVILLIFELYLAFAYRHAFCPMLAMKTCSSCACDRNENANGCCKGKE